MVRTRTQAREDELAKKREAQQLEVQCQTDEQNTSRHLSRANTLIEIVPSATGQGTHTRWIRQNPASPEPTEPSDLQPEEVTVDQRYITPAPTSLPTPGAPHKARGIHGIHTAAVSPPIWNIKTLQNIEEEPVVDGDSMNTLGSPFPGRHNIWQSAAEPHPLRPEPTILVDAEPFSGGRTDTEIVEDANLRRAFGPNGTHLYNSRGEEIFV